MPDGMPLISRHRIANPLFTHLIGSPVVPNIVHLLDAHVKKHCEEAHKPRLAELMFGGSATHAEDVLAEFLGLLGARIVSGSINEQGDSLGRERSSPKKVEVVVGG
jgi:hypothetical protein